MTSDNELLQTTDGMVWAKEFTRRFTIVGRDRPIDDQVGLMVGWFANAIEVGRDAGSRR